MEIEGQISPENEADEGEKETNEAYSVKLT
jgi:hypothetical protein